MTSIEDQANFTRLSRLLVDKGTEALRITLDSIYPPAALPYVLSANRAALLKLKPRVINNLQWDLLFPPSGDPPSSKTFDVTILTVLLRNICALPPPATGWNTMPPDTDTSLEANITRIKLFRNQIYAHVSSTQLDKTTFEDLWRKISLALVNLKIPQQEINDLKTGFLGPEEKNYVQIITEWISKEGECKNMLENIQEYLTTNIEHLTEEIQKLGQLREIEYRKSDSWGSKVGKKYSNHEESQLLQKLAKHNFKSKIRSKAKLFHRGTRDWLLKGVERWFTKEDESSLLLITAGPGFGKSVFAAKICQIFKEKQKLAACHFCDHSGSNLNNPKMMLESLASHISENVPEFKEILLDQLKRPHEVNSLKDAFQIYLQNPLDDLEMEKESKLIVIDGLDESTTEDRSDVAKLIVDHFPDLPKCMKVLVTSRPGLSLKKLEHIQVIEIDAKHKENDSDLLKYLTVCLPKFNFLPAIVTKCEGSFLYASHVQHELRRKNDVDSMTSQEIMSFLPEGMDSVYKEYFHRLETELEAVMKKKPDLIKVLELLATGTEGLPLGFIARALSLDRNCRETKRTIDKVNEAVSCLLYISKEEVTIFHKSVHDWLLGNGYNDHKYTVKVIDGQRLLWLLCEQIFQEIKRDVSSGLELKQTNDVKHALENGHEYLLESNMTGSFSWLVDMVIVQVEIAVYPKSTGVLRNVLKNALLSDVKISVKLRQRISWHFLEIRNTPGDEPNFSYLKSVLDCSPEALFTDDERKIAKEFLAKSHPGVNRIWTSAKHVSLPLAKLFHLYVSAFGTSSNKKLVAVALTSGTICVFNLPDLEKVLEHSTKNKDICCCTFAPDSSFVLYGKLEKVLDITRKEEIPFFKENKEIFISCAFSLSGKRLVTVDGSRCVKLWDVPGQCLLTVLDAGVELDTCSFSSTGLFIVGNHKYPVDDAYCVWNSITFERVDQRSLYIGKLNKRRSVPKSERCNRCLRQECTILITSTQLEINPYEQLYRRGIYDGVDCIFYLYSRSLRVIECIHFTTLGVWDIYTKVKSKFAICDLTEIQDNLWLCAHDEKLIVFRTTPLKQNRPCPSLPARVLWCSFSSDGTRLASCTSDGHINIWNVDTCQVYQRFRNNFGTREVVCWWSVKYLFVCHIIDDVLSLSRYTVGDNLIIMTTQKQIVAEVDMATSPGKPKILNFSDGFLYFSCKEDTVQSFDVNENRHTPKIILPGCKSMMSITVSNRASFLFAASNNRITLCKGNKDDPTAYEVFADVDIETENNRPMYCFSNDSKFAITCYRKNEQTLRVVVVNLCTGVVSNCEVQSLYPLYSHSRLKVFSTDAVFILVRKSSIEIFHLYNGKRLGFCCQDNLDIDDVQLSKLSPEGRVLAIPDSFGDMQFYNLSISNN